MVPTKSVLLAASGVLFGLVALNLKVAPPAVALCAPVPKGLEIEPTIRVRLTLNKADVVIGEAVRLQESIPAAPVVKVSSIDHKVVRVGRYSPRSRGLVHLDHSKHVVRSNGLFVGKECLPNVLGYAGIVKLPGQKQMTIKGEEFRLLGLGRRGEVTEFTPERLGMFLIWSEWEVVDDPVPWHSQPVVLTVRPPLDADGKPVVKDEWLKDD